MSEVSSLRTNDESEARLFTRAAQGDAAAFEALCLRLEQPLFGYLVRLVKNRAEAEELAQETLLRVYQAARDGQLEPERGSVRALVFSIAHNLAVDFHRRARNVTPLALARPASASAGVEAALLREQIDRALADLPETHRSALMLREFGDLTYAEIADTLGISPGMVKTWIYRARRRLADLLDRDGQYVGEQTNGA